ncbi:MAG: M48 family metallopeptidase [Thermoproteota archaeon]
MGKSVPYNIVYRNIKYPRLEYKTGTLQLILPKNYQSPEELVQKYGRWIKEKETVISKSLEEAKTKTITERTDEEFKKIVREKVKGFKKELGTRVNRIFFRKMRTKWASCSRNNNLTVNVLAKYLPQETLEYIIFHEITHTLERKHNEHFWNLVGKSFPDYESREGELLAYWFAIQKKLGNECCQQVEEEIR